MQPDRFLLQVRAQSTGIVATGLFISERRPRDSGDGSKDQRDKEGTKVPHPLTPCSSCSNRLCFWVARGLSSGAPAPAKVRAPSLTPAACGAAEVGSADSRDGLRTLPLRFSGWSGLQASACVV